MISYTKGVTNMSAGDVQAAIDLGEGAAGSDYRVEILDTGGNPDGALYFSTEPLAIERAAEVIANQIGYSAVVWGKLHTLASVES